MYTQHLNEHTLRILLQVSSLILSVEPTQLTAIASLISLFIRRRAAHQHTPYHRPLTFIYLFVCLAPKVLFRMS